MKISKLTTCFIALSLTVLVAISCAKKDDDDDPATTGTGTGSGTGTGTGGAPSVDNFFYDSALETIPALEASESFLLTDEWNFGNVMYEVFDLFQEYVDERDQGKIGLPNIFKSLYQTGSFYDGAKTMCETITEKSITSPYADQGSGNYDCVINDEQTDGHHGYAIKETSTTKDAILTWTASSFAELGVVKGTYNESTGAVIIDLTGNSEGFSWRLKMTGNEKSKFFDELYMMKYTPEGYKISIVGQGFAEGEDKYFLFRIMDSDTAELTTAKYFCFEADASEATLQAMSAAADGVEYAAISANCEDYKVAVAAMTMFPMDGSKVPLGQSDFTGTGDYKILLNLD